MRDVLAHMGGVDEVAFVVVPLAVMALLSWLGRRRGANDDAPENEDRHGGGGGDG